MSWTLPCACVADLANGDLAQHWTQQQRINTYDSYDRRAGSCIDHFAVPLPLSSHISQLHVVEYALNDSNDSPVLMHVYVSVLGTVCPAP